MSVSALRTLSQAALILLLFLPLLVVEEVLWPAIVTRVVVFRVVVGAGLAVLLMRVLVARPRVRQRDPFLLAFLAFVLVSALAGLLGYAPQRSLFGTLQRMWGVVAWLYLLGYYVLLRVFLVDDAWRWLLRASLEAGLLVALYALAQRFPTVLSLPVVHPGVARPDSTLGNSSYLAIYLVLGVGLAAFLAAGEASLRGRVVYALAGALQLWVMSLAGGMAAAGGLVAGTVIGCGYLALTAPGGWAMRRAGAAMAAAAALVLAIVAVRSVELPLFRRLAEVGLDSPTFQVRFAYWGAAWRGFLDRPLLGAGPETFSSVFSAHFPPAYYLLDELSYPDRAHDAYLEQLATAGALGLVAYLAMGVALMAGIVVAHRRGRLSGAAAAALLGMVVAYAVYLLMWFEDHNSLLVMVAIAAYVGHRAWGGPLLEFEPRPREAKRTLAAGVAVTIVTLFTWQHAVRPLQAAVAAQEALGASPVERKLAAFHRATPASVSEADETVTLFVDYLQSFTPLLDEVRADAYRARVLHEALVDAAAALDRTLARDPRNDLWHLPQGGLLSFAAAFLQDRRCHEQALAALEQAIELSPTRLRTYHVLADTHLLAGDTDAANRVLDRAEVVFDRFGETDVFRARVLVVEGRTAAAVAALRAGWAKGYARETGVVGEVVTRLDESGAVTAAAALALEYLDVRYGGYLEADDGANLSPGDDALAVRLPALLVRAGEAELARRATAAYTTRTLSGVAGSPRSSALPPG